MDCTNLPLEWNPTVSAQPHSAFAGVLAGLVFAGIVVLVSERGTTRPHRQSRYRSLMILTVSLFSLALDAFLFSLVAGERGCAKAWTVTMPAAGLLGLGALGIFAGVSWLFFAYDNGPLVTISNVISYAVAIVVGTFFQANAESYLSDMQNWGFLPETWLTTFVSWIGRFTFAAVLVIAGTRWQRSIPYRRRRRLETAEAKHRLEAAAAKNSEATDDENARRDVWVALASYLVVVYVVAVAVLAGWLVNRATSQYEPATPVYVAEAAVAVALFPLLAVFALLNALPIRQAAAEGTSVDDAPRSGSGGPDSALDAAVSSEAR